jgi:hypothetical protein
MSNGRYTGTTMRDGKTVGRRISAPAFHSFGQSALVGSFGVESGVLTTTLTLSATDPTNPFIHRYHPNHLVPIVNDPISANNTPAEQVYEIVRAITLRFADKDADNNKGV